MDLTEVESEELASREGRQRPFSSSAEHDAETVGKHSLLTKRDRITMGLMAGIPALLHIALVWVPAIGTFILSFSNWNGVAFDRIKWVRFRNFEQIFTVFEKDFYEGLLNNLWVLVFLFFVGTPLGMLIAYLLDKELKGSAIYQSLFYTPVVLSLAVVGFIWKSVMYSPAQGLLNTVLGRTEQGNQIDWLGNSDFLLQFSDNYGLTKNFVALIVPMIWQHVGYIMVLYLAGLKSVDPNLREAAAIDGANEWQAFRRVVFPALKPVNIVIMVITVITGLRVFDIIDVLNNPNGTNVLSVLVVDSILGEASNVGRGSAYAVILLLLCLIFVIMYLRNAFRQVEVEA